MKRRSASVLLAAALLGARWVLRDWGARPVERVGRLAGDELVPGRAEVVTRAVTIEAPAEAVWRWLVQIGQDRAGMYSYDWLENLIGLGIHSARRIHPEWQHLRVGDSIRLVPPHWLGLPDGIALPIARIDEGRSIVMRMKPPDSPWDAVWSFHVLPIGAARCRLISRSRTARRGGVAWVVAQLLDPITFVMTRRMLIGIRQRAEREAGCERPSGTREYATAVG